MQIIIVGDDADEIEWLQSALGSSGLVAVRGFTHPAAALDWCLNHQPDLVMVSFLMRAIDGIEFTRRFRAIPGQADLPVLLMHPPAAVSVRPDAMRFGVTDFLMQPVELMELAARASTLLALRQARLQLLEREWRQRVSAVETAVVREDAPRAPNKSALLH